MEKNPKTGWSQIQTLFCHSQLLGLEKKNRMAEEAGADVGTLAPDWFES